MSSKDAKSYRRDVAAYLVCIQQEDDSILQDLRGVGIEADMRRAAVDGVISEMWDRNMHNLCSALQVAGVSARQAAQVFSAFVLIDERSR